MNAQKTSAVPSYQDMLDEEQVAVPACLRENTQPDLGCANLSVDRYLSREFHEQEVEHVWKRTWQMVCRETEIAQPGDCQLYEITRYSIMVARTEAGELKAFHNACLHRGRALVDASGQRENFRCPYHGFTWNLDGSFKSAPCRWDFDHIKDAEFSLPEVQVDTWGGWVFINMDPAAPPLHDYLDILPQHFERWEPENCYKGVHVQKVIPCNWKVGWEAFIESYHAVATHPQILPYTADSSSQYDVWGDHISRTITAMAAPSPHLKEISEQDVANALLGTSALVAGGEENQVPEGQTAREFIAERSRASFQPDFAENLEGKATRSELLDSILYSVFPNFAPWAGFRPNITYRFRPNGDDHQSALMEIILLMRYHPGKPRPADVPPRLMGEDELFSQAPELGESLGTVFDQDLFNMPRIQQGLHNLLSGEVVLGHYQEIRIRHFHRTLDKYISGEL
jgi:phenylpropionate dioxygenase-like ring-hydroxylating dioxygenase large terminal subunit